MDHNPPRPLFTEDAIRQRVDELAREISHDYADKGEILMIGVLKGAFIFLADLSRRLSIPRSIDFIAVASYGNSTVPSDSVRLILDVRSDIRDRHVLIVEDVIDSGSTLVYLHDLFAVRAPASLRTCAFLRKSQARRAAPGADYIGFDVEDNWVVGYGLDFADRYRALPYIGVLPPGPHGEG